MLIDIAKPAGEMAQSLRLASEFHTTHGIAVFKHFLHDLDDIIHLALRVRPSGDSQADKIHPCRYFGAIRLQSEHGRANLATPDATMPVKLNRE